MRLSLLALIWHVALLLTLALVSPVAAECAWLLWEEQESIMGSQAGGVQQSSSWKLHSALQTKADCERLLTLNYESSLTQWRSGPQTEIQSLKSTRGYIGLIFKPTAAGLIKSYSANYRCLPDTIDPRGPKR